MEGEEVEGGDSLTCSLVRLSTHVLTHPPHDTCRLPRPDRSGAGSHSHAAPPGHFVTALQWRRSSPHLLAANSAGYVWVLGLKL